MLPESRYVRANRINHHYLAWGSSEKPALMMVHGIGMCAQVWNRVARDLARDFRVMSFDLRGHGDTEKPSSGYTYPQLGEDLVELVHALQLKQPYAVGHSIGGTAALIANSIAPGVIGSTVLVETRVSPRPDLASAVDRQARLARTREKRAVWESREEMYAAYRGRQAFQSWTEEVFRDFIEGATRLLNDGHAELKCSPEVEALFYEAREFFDISHYLKDLKGEYLLLLGDYSGPEAQTLDSEGVHRFRELVRGAQIKPMGLGTHFLPMEYPELVAQEVSSFLLQRQVR